MMKSMLENYAWFKDATLKACDSSYQKYLATFIDVNDYPYKKPRFHVSNNPRRLEGPWSNFELVQFEKTTDLIRYHPLPWQKDVLRMINSEPSNQIMWIYTVEISFQENRFQGKQLFLQYVQENGLAQIIHLHNMMDLKKIYTEINANPKKSNNIIFYVHAQVQKGFDWWFIWEKLDIKHTCTVFFFINEKFQRTSSNKDDNVFVFGIWNQKLIDD